MQKLTQKPTDTRLFLLKGSLYVSAWILKFGSAKFCGHLLTMTEQVTVLGLLSILLSTRLPVFPAEKRRSDRSGSWLVSSHYQFYVAVHSALGGGKSGSPVSPDPFCLTLRSHKLSLLPHSCIYFFICWEGWF